MNLNNVGNKMCLKHENMQVHENGVEECIRMHARANRKWRKQIKQIDLKWLHSISLHLGC